MFDRMFPEELLKGKVEEKWNFFWNYPLDHPEFNITFKNIISQIGVSQGIGSVILVYGPTRVGKSFLAEKLYEVMDNKYKQEKEQNKGLIPVIKIEALAPEKGQFDWQTFYISALEQLQDVLIEHKNTPEVPIVPKGVYKKHRENRKVSVLNISLKNALRNRQTKVMIIDEAHHMSKRLRGDTLQNQMDVLKGLSNVTQIPIVMLGTYELQIFKEQSGQLASREFHNHLSRYNYENEKERNNFLRCLYSFQKLLPLKFEPYLIDHYKFFYSRTLGCIGQLKMLLFITLKGKLIENPLLETLEIGDFEKYALTLNQCKKILEEIVQGETLEINNITEETLFTQLGLIEENGQDYSTEDTDKENSKGENQEKSIGENSINKKNKNGKPFKRNPKRDSIKKPEGFDNLKRVID